MRALAVLIVTGVLVFGVAGCSKTPRPEDNPRFNPASKTDPSKAFPRAGKLDPIRPPPEVLKGGANPPTPAGK